MIQVYACASLTEVNEHIWRHVQGGDVLTQDWIITSHPAQNRWLSQQLANQMSVRTQIEIYSNSAWLKKLKHLVWPLAPQPVSAAQIAWTLLSIGPEWITQEKQASPLAKILSSKTSMLGGQRYQAAHQLAHWMIQVMRHKPHWLQAWLLNDSEIDQHASPTWWPSLYRHVNQALQGKLQQNTCIDLCEHIQKRASHIQSQVRHMIFCGQHMYQGETLKLIQTLSKIIPVYCYSIDPILSRTQNHSVQEIFKQVHNPLLQGASYGFIAHYNERIVRQESHPLSTFQQIPSDYYPRQLPIPSQLQQATKHTTVRQSLLKSLQEIICQPSPLPDTATTVIPNDYSLQFHETHSDQRQVDALYQVLCACLRRDPSLQPRDILVLVPDIERLIPLITAVFNGQENDHIHLESWPTQSDTEADNLTVDHTQYHLKRLGAEIARPKGLNPFADLLIHFLNVAGSRLYRYDVLQLLKNPLVSERFSLELPQILQLDQWLRQSGVRWGLDPEHRINCGLNEEAQHTWQFGIDRLLMGHVVGNESGLFQGVAPLHLGQEDDSFVHFLDFFIVMKDLIPLVSKARTSKEWYHTLMKVGRCLTRPQGEGRWLLNELESDLYQSLSRGAPQKHRLTPQAIIKLLQSGLGRKSMLLNAGKDHVRFYPIDQAYAVPARVICFLDMNEKHFPHIAQNSTLTPSFLEDNVLDHNPLDQQYAYAMTSILAAQEAVHFFYQGQTAHHVSQSLSPLLYWIQEEMNTRYLLSDSVSDTPSETTMSTLVEHITVKHPLHPFSPQNFSSTQAPLPNEATISHEPIWLHGAECWRHSMFNPQSDEGFAVHGVETPARALGKIHLNTLAKLLKNPSEFFLKRGVGMHILKDEDMSKERELLDLNALQNWKLKDRALQLFFELEAQGVEPRDQNTHLLDCMRAEGLLPVGGMGQVSFESTFEEVKVLYERFCEVRQSAEKQPMAFAVHLPSGTPVRVEGDVLFENQLIFTSMSKHIRKSLYRGKQLLEPWLYHVALSASGKSYEGATLVSSDGNFKTFPQLAPEQAQNMLDQWVDYMDKGVHHPLRFDPDLSFSYLQHKRQLGLDGLDHGKTLAMIEQEWKDSRQKEDLYTLQAFDGQAPWRDADHFHPDFLHLSELIFAPLEEAIYQHQAGQE